MINEHQSPFDNKVISSLTQQTFKSTRGRTNQEILKQNQYSPLRVDEQIAVIYCSSNGFFDGVDLKNISKLEKEYLDTVNSKHKELLDELAEGKVNEKSLEKLGEVAKKAASNYKS